MNEQTFKKYIIKSAVSNSRCHQCGGTGIRNHFARLIMQDLGVESFTCPCYHCRQEDFRAYVINTFLGRPFGRVLEHYSPNRSIP